MPAQADSYHYLLEVALSALTEAHSILSIDNQVADAYKWSPRQLRLLTDRLKMIRTLTIDILHRSKDQP